MNPSVGWKDAGPPSPGRGMGNPREEVKVIIIILSQKNKPEGIPVIPRDPGDVYNPPGSLALLDPNPNLKLGTTIWGRSISPSHHAEISPWLKR